MKQFLSIFVMMVLASGMLYSNSAYAYIWPWKIIMVKGFPTGAESVIVIDPPVCNPDDLTNC